MKVLCLSNIKHQGIIYGDGEMLEVSESEGRRLVELNVAKQIKETQKVAEKSQPKKTKEVKKKVEEPKVDEPQKDDQQDEQVSPEGEPSRQWSAAQLRDYALANGIELDDEDTKVTILKKIEEASGKEE